MLTPAQVRENGAIIRPDEVPDTMKYDCRTKLLMAPTMGSALTGCEVVYHRPGDVYQIHMHPLSEAVIAVFRGSGQVYLAGFWYEVRRGDVIYVPENVKHGMRNPITNSEDFICYCWQVPYLSEFETIPGARDEVFEGEDGQVIPYDARGRFDARIPWTGVITDINHGALFTAYDAEMRFVVWPGMGARKISSHRALHPPGVEFKVHIHPGSEDTILAFQGSGQGFLVDRWHDMEEGDVMFAPRPIKHGTRNPAGRSKEPFICLGSAGPPLHSRSTGSHCRDSADR